MKINSPSDNTVAISSNAASLAAKAGPSASLLARSTATKSTQPLGVAVTVSTMVRSMEAGGEAADFDTEKVNSVRQAIAQGTYKVNPEAIADKLLSNAQEMLKRTRI